MGIDWVNAEVNWATPFRGTWEVFVRSLSARMLLVYYLLRALFSPRLGEALEVVKGVATDPSTRSLNTWELTQRTAVSNPKWGENMYRGLAARVRFGSHSPEAALLIEMAYLAYKRRKRI